MPKYAYEITETLSKVIVLEADNEDDYYDDENYSDYLENRSCFDETMSRPYDYDFDQTKEFQYPAPFLAGDYRQIEFISNGNLVTVPSSFITRIIVRMEGIYEK